MTNAMFKRLPVSGVLGSNAVGAVLSLGPQAYADVRDAGLLDQPGREQNWK